MELINSIDAKSLIRQSPSLLKTARGVKSLANYVAKTHFRDPVNYPLLLEYIAEKYANNIAIKYRDRALTYRELNHRANQIAHYLQQQGIQSGDVVALFMENRPEYLIYMAAISKLGAVVALINHSQRGDVLIHSLTLVSAKAVITGEEVMEALVEVEDKVSLTFPIYWVPDEDSDWTKQNSAGEFCNIDAASQSDSTENLTCTKAISSDAPCLYIYTSGTTGLPKAAIQKHRKIGLITLGLGFFLSDVKPSDTIYNCLPLYHATGLFFSWLSAMGNGAAIAIRKKFSASEFWSDINRYDATIFVYIGELCRYLLNQPPSPLERQHKLRMVTGNGLRPDLWDEFKSRFHIKEIREFYGSSEGNLVCYNLLNQRQTMGLVLGSYAIVDVDTETEQPVRDQEGFLIKSKTGSPGLLLGRITMATPFEGYTDSSKNDAKIIRNAFKKGDAWFNTGDIVKSLGFRHLQFVDRTGDTYRWKGENVSTGEVEMFVNKFPGIEETIAYGVEIPNTNGRAGMVAIRLNDGNDTIDLKALHHYLCKQLPAYAVPVFVRTLSAVNATGTFKYQRTTLKKESFYQTDYANTADKAYVALPGGDEYTLIEPEILDGIEKNRYRF